MEVTQRRKAVPHVESILTVFGATGAQGGGLARAALADPKRRFRVRAVTRKPGGDAARALASAGADVVAADLDDPASVRRAMEGAHAAFCVTNFWEHRSPDREIAQAHAMAEAAASAGVAHVIWSTLEDTREFIPLASHRLPVLMGRFLVPHFDGKGEANRAFTDRGVPTTLLYPSVYWDNLIHFGMHPTRGADGRLALALPLGEAKLPGIAAADVGPCAFGIFARGGDLVGKSVGIAGEHTTGAQMAARLSHALGEPVAYEPMSVEAYRALDFPGADDLASMFAWKREFEHGYCASRSVACARALNPALMDFAAWLARNASFVPIERAAA
jgi:uncharacterized protein YbjT (DUF2867 family)